MLQTICSIALASYTASRVIGAAVGLAWDPNPEPDISTYIIYYGNESGKYLMATNVGNITEAKVSGLAAGKEWFFALTAVNTSGLESEFSNEVAAYIHDATGTNLPPTISQIKDQVTESGSTSRVDTTVWDPDVPAYSLSLSASSTNSALVPATNITFKGTGMYRSAYIRPTPNSYGTSRITLTVSDGQKSANASFVLTVLPPPDNSQFYLRVTTVYETSVHQDGQWEHVTTTVFTNAIKRALP